MIKQMEIQWNKFGQWKKSQPISEPDQLGTSVNLKELERHIFFEKDGDIYIGGEKIKHELRSLLKDQAEYFQKSNLFEILEATATDESIKLIFKSANMEHVQYAKALQYWNNIFIKMINALVK